MTPNFTFSKSRSFTGYRLSENDCPGNSSNYFAFLNRKTCFYVKFWMILSFKVFELYNFLNYIILNNRPVIELFVPFWPLDKNRFNIFHIFLLKLRYKERKRSTCFLIGLSRVYASQQYSPKVKHTIPWVCSRSHPYKRLYF